MTFFYILYLLFVIGVLFYLFKIKVSFNTRIILGLVWGGLTGAFMQYLHTPEQIQDVMNIYKIIGVGYINFLRQLIYPIIAIGTLYAMTKIGENSHMGKVFISIILVLLITTSIAALSGILVSIIFDIDLSRFIYVDGIVANLQDTTNLITIPLYEKVTNFISINPFADLAGTRPNSVASCVIFFMVLGCSYLAIKKTQPDIAAKFKNGVEVLYHIIMKLVDIILELTPYGIFALFCNVTATTNLADLNNLLSFVLATYLAIFIMFIVHILLLICFKINPFKYLANSWQLLCFAFMSRSSAASIPLNIQTQTKKMNIDDATATLSSTFITVFGQNGVGIYSTITTFAVANTLGLDVMNWEFIFTLIAVTLISSFGSAGINGGAVFTTISVLSTFNLPLTIIAFVKGIDPIIDMGRTALNVNASVISSVITNKIVKFTKKTKIKKNKSINS